MSLLRRIEQAQQQQQGGGTSSVTPTLGTTTPPPPPLGSLGAVRSDREKMLQDLRVRLQDAVVGIFPSMGPDTGVPEIKAKIEELLAKLIVAQGVALTQEQRLRLVEETVHEVTGFGPIEPYLADPTITEVMVNGPNQVYIERRGKIELTPTRFMNDEHVLKIIDRIITPLGRRIDDMSPRVDARLPDGSRVNAIIPPLALTGPTITIRKFAAKPYTVEDLIRFGTATRDMFDFLKACIEARLNIFVSGGTGSGKTTTLNVLSSFIPWDERIITIEDSAELQLHQEHIVTLEARPMNVEGEGEITIRDLMRNAMHMRPDRIVVGECRGGEALDMLQAMTTGHSGSLSTGHANTAADMLRRLETMVLMTGYELPLRAIREQIAQAVDLIVHTARLKDGSRKIVNITEVYGMEDDQILTQDIFMFEQTGIVDGKIQGELKPTGIRPTFMPRFESEGVKLPPGAFGIPPEDPLHPDRTRSRKGGWDASAQASDPLLLAAGKGSIRKAGGMVYISSVGPVDLESGRIVSIGIKEQSRKCMENLKRLLEDSGTSLERIVWGTWSLRDATEFDDFFKEWERWFPDGAPPGQGTLMTSLQRRAGFRITLGVIAQQ